MVKTRNKNKKNQNENSKDEVDPLAGNTEAQDTVLQSKQGKKRKKKNMDDWEDDVASGVQALSLQTKSTEESEEEDMQPVKKKKKEKKKKKGNSDKEEEESMGRKPKATFQMLMMDDDDNDLPSEVKVVSTDHNDDNGDKKKRKKKRKKEEAKSKKTEEGEEKQEDRKDKGKDEKGDDGRKVNVVPQKRQKRKVEVVSTDNNDDGGDNKKRKKKEAKSKRTEKGEEKHKDRKDKGEVNVVPLGKNERKVRGSRQKMEVEVVSTDNNDDGGDNKKRGKKEAKSKKRKKGEEKHKDRKDKGEVNVVPQKKNEKRVRESRQKMEVKVMSTDDKDDDGDNKKREKKGEKKEAKSKKTEKREKKQEDRKDKGEVKVVPQRKNERRDRESRQKMEKKEEGDGRKSQVGATSLCHDETEDREDAKSLPPSSDNAFLLGIDDFYLQNIYTTALNHSRKKPFNTYTCLFCTIKGDNNPIMKRNKQQKCGSAGVHAEKLLIKELNNHAEVKKSTEPSYSGPDLDITLYINHSPCSYSGHDCKKELKMFLKEHKKVRVNLYIASIHNVYRESCRRKNHTNCITGSEEVHFESSVELWNLMQHGRCTVSAYSKETWEKLFDLARESKELLGRYGEKVFEDQGVSRETEDKQIGEDLRYIGVEMLKKLYKVCSDEPDKEYAKRTCLVCNINVKGSNIKLAKYDKEDEHAEELLLKELSEMEVGDERLTITIFMNDIPCSLSKHKCAHQLIDFLEKKNIDLTLYVTRLYELAQENCTKHGHRRYCSLQKTDHSSVLKELQKHRCTIKAPCKNAWDELLSIMNIGEEDQIFHEFWDKYSIEETEDDRTRKGEDKRIRSYLNKIFKK